MQTALRGLTFFVARSRLSDCTARKNLKRHITKIWRQIPWGCSRLPLKPMWFPMSTTPSPLLGHFPKSCKPPSPGKWARTPTATSPSTKPHLRVTLYEAEENGTRTTPWTTTQLPVSDCFEKGKTDSKMRNLHPQYLSKFDLEVFGHHQSNMTWNTNWEVTVTRLRLHLSLKLGKLSLAAPRCSRLNLSLLWPGVPFRQTVTTSIRHYVKM